MRLVMDARARRLLRRLGPVNVYSVAELALMALMAIQAARLVWAVLTPVAPLGDWRPATPAVAGSPADILSGFDPFFRLSGGSNAGAATVTALQLTLFGTRIDEASGRGSAIIAGPDQLQKSIAVGEEIVPGVKLKSVAFDHVTLDRHGADEDLFIDQSGAVTPVVPGQASPPAMTMDARPGGTPPPARPGGVQVSQIRSEIGFIPRIDNGRISGLVVRPQGTGALFRSAGLQSGDVVTAIGGRPVTGPQDVDRVATEFVAGGTIPLTVERGNQTIPMAIQVAPQQ